jgi:Protein of unknown function (DUF1592)/Protein of unknown function (DUF1588)/Protein of unknown function (DUF1595)/Protein of unknown function (DUF1587)
MRRIFQVPVFLVGAIAGCFATSTQAWADSTYVRLTPDQYRHAIHDIFGASIHIDDNFVEPGFRDEGLLALGTRKLTLTSAGAERYEALAQQVAAQVVEERRRATLVPCKPQSEANPDDRCAGAFIDKVGLFLFRRPLTKTELKSFVTTQNDAAQKLHSFNFGLAAALTEMLVAPEFLFRVEHSEPNPATGKLELDAYSRAARLSFFLWDTSPDAELLAAARSGKLMTERGLQEQTERLLDSPRLEYGVRGFFSDMLGFDGFSTLSIDSNLYPKFTKNVQEDAPEQTLRTIVDHLLVKNRDYRDLFTTPDTFLTPALAALYGVPLARSQELGGAVPWVAYEYPSNDPRVGLLSQVSFLSLNSHPGKSSPTLRGKALREELLCQKVPPPPGNVDFSLVQDTSNPKYKTVRQRLTAHRKEAMCAGCHKIMDPVGLAMENFDTASEFRTTENGATIDASGDINGKHFDGMRQLADAIKDDPATTACVITRAFSYGSERKPTEQERTWLASVQTDLTKSGVKWRELARRISVNPDFYTIPGAPSPMSANAQK